MQTTKPHEYRELASPSRKKERKKERKTSRANSSIFARTERTKRFNPYPANVENMASS
jgi:hypothetical protein